MLLVYVQRSTAVDWRNSFSRHDEAAPSRHSARSRSSQNSLPPAYENAVRGDDVTPPTASARDVSHFSPGVTVSPSNADTTVVNARPVGVSGDALQPGDVLMVQAPPYAPRDTAVSPPPYGPPPAYSDAALHKLLLPHQSLSCSQHDSGSSLHNGCSPLSPHQLQPLSSQDNNLLVNSDAVQQVSTSPHTSQDSVSGFTHKFNVTQVDIGDVDNRQTTLGHIDNDNAVKVNDNDTLASVT